MKKRKKHIVLAIACGISILLLFSGCSLVKVDTTKDNAQVIGTIKHTKIKKESYNNALADTALTYTMNGQMIPSGEELKQLEKDTKESVLNNAAIVQKAKDDKIKIDESKAKKDGEKQYQNVKKQSKKKYQSTLKTYNTNDKSFHAYMVNTAVQNAYADKMNTNFQKTFKKHPDKYLNKKIGTANHHESITTGEYYYYWFRYMLQQYQSGQQNANQQNTNDIIIKKIASDKAWVNYADKHHIKISNALVNREYQSIKKKQEKMVPVKSQDTTFSNFNLTTNAVTKYRKQEAKANAAKKAIKSQLKSDNNPSDNDMQNYFKSHKTKFVKNTVSAEHILSSDKKDADKIYQEAKNIKNKKEFDKLITKYKKAKHIKEAADLGAFEKEQMVPAFSNAAFNAQVNHVTKPVKTQYGYHVIFVYKKHQAGNNWKDYKKDIKKAISSDKTNQKYQKLKQKINEDVDYRYKEEDIKTPFILYVENIRSSYTTKA